MGKSCNRGCGGIMDITEIRKLEARVYGVEPNIIYIAYRNGTSIYDLSLIHI